MPACTGMAGYLDESQRLFSAADQRGLLLLLLLHDGGEGYCGGQGRAAHPRPEGDRRRRGTREHARSGWMLQRQIPPPPIAGLCAKTPDFSNHAPDIFAKKQFPIITLLTDKQVCTLTNEKKGFIGQALPSNAPISCLFLFASDFSYRGHLNLYTCPHLFNSITVCAALSSRPVLYLCNLNNFTHMDEI